MVDRIVFEAQSPTAWDLQRDSGRITIYFKHGDVEQGVSILIDHWKKLVPAISSLISRYEADVGTAAPLGTTGKAEEVMMIRTENLVVDVGLLTPDVVFGIDPDSAVGVWLGMPVEQAERLALAFQAAAANIRKRDREQAH